MSLLARTAALLALSSFAFSQQDSQPYVFKSRTDVVNVLATVHDKDGHVVSKLNQQDFRLEEDGRPQTIKYFARETDLPLTLGILVDTSPSQRRVLSEEQAASLQFLQQTLREDRDLAFVLHFDWEVELLQDLTSSRQKLNAALEDARPTEAPQRGYGGGGWHRGGGTDLYDAVYLASDDVLKNQTGRKALILLTDGVDTGSRLTLERAIQKCLERNTMVYSILFSDETAYGGRSGWSMGTGFPGGWGGRRGGWGGPQFPGGGGGEQVDRGKRVLRELSEQTGGRYFEVSKKHSLSDIYRDIEEELRSQYNLGYTPETRTAGFHRISVTTTNPNLKVAAREGYYGGETQTATAKP